MHVAPFWHGEDEHAFEACFNLNLKCYYNIYKYKSWILMILPMLQSVPVKPERHVHVKVWVVR